MQSFFSGMLPFEIILAAMGVLVVLALLFILIWSVIKQRAITTIFPFFIIPIIMVGYPSLKSIQLGNAILTLKSETNQLTQNLQDSTARIGVENAMAVVKSNVRSQSSGNALASIARAEIALGKYDSAAVYLRQAETLMPGSAETANIKHTLDTKIQEHQIFARKISSVNRLLILLKGNNADTGLLRNLNAQLADVKVPTYVQANDLRLLARAYAVIGHQDISLKALNKAAADTKSPADNKLADSIRRQTIQNAYLSPQVKTSVNTQPKKAPTLRLDRTVISPR